jgi:hypothetical protein
MDALAHHDVGQGYARGENSHAHLAAFRFRTVFQKDAKFIGSAIVIDDDPRVGHDYLPPNW